MIPNAPQIWLGETAETAALLDCTKVALPLEITHGRSSPSVQPEAASFAFTYIGADAPPGQMGDYVVVRLELPNPGAGATWTDPTVGWASPGRDWAGAVMGDTIRFVGRVVSVTATAELGHIAEWRVACLATMGDLGTTPVTYGSGQGQTDANRVTALFAAAGITDPPVILGTAEKALIADNVDRDLLSAVHEICASTAGLFFQARDGRYAYGLPDHRTGDPSMTLPCTAITDGAQWAASYEGVVNYITLTWGPQENQNTYRNDPSIARWGFRAVSITTMLRDEQAADEFAQTILARRADPFWMFGGIEVDSRNCEVIDHYYVNLAEIGTGVVLPLDVDPGPLEGMSAPWTIEGWRETWDRDPSTGELYQSLVYTVSDRQRWGAYALRTWTGVAAHDWQFWTSYTWLEQLSRQEL